MAETIAGRYSTVKELGRGGMGTVYLVADTLQDNRQVALKMIQVQGAITPELRLRFKEEFRSMTKLKHPNTIEVFDYGELDAKTQFLTMEVVPGHELTELARGKHMPYDQIYTTLIQLLQALGFIHSRLYVHRDIKSENIRIRDDGTLKLMDFGLMDQLGVPSNGKLTGTPGYLPPEVAKGGVINASSDLYSVGCLAYELITGRLPFEGGVLEVVKAHIHQEPTPIRHFRPDVSDRLEAIVSKLMAKDQAHRYQQAAEVIADLADLGGISIGASNIEQKKSYLTSSVLVGRDKELGQLSEALEAVQAGQGRSVFVGAPAGVGKSRLVQELLLQAKLNEVLVLHGQCLESGMSPFEPLAQALRPIVALSTPEEVAQFGPALARVLPEFNVEAAAPLDPQHEKLRFNEAVVGWLKAVTARRPLVLFFDDLHWSDAQSLETFNACIRELTGSRLMCLATFRNDETPPSSPIWFTVEEGLTQFLKLNLFNLPQVMMLLQAMLRDVKITKEISEFLYNATSGNAFFLTEVLRYMVEEGVLTLKEGIWHFPADVSNLQVPTSVEGTVVRRLAQLSDDARKLAGVASVLGRYQDREMLLTVSGLDEDALFTRLEELIERQFLVRDEQRYTFPHDRVREALYADLSEEARKDLHQRCGEYLERVHAGDKATVLNELAYHFSNGRDGFKAYSYLREAGDRAKASGIGMLTIENWSRAEEVLDTLDLPNKEELQVDLWFAIGSYGFEIAPRAAIKVLDKCVRVLEAQGNVDSVCNVLKGAVGLVKKLPAKARTAVIAKLTAPVPYHHKVRTGLAKLVPPPPPAWVPRVIESYTFLGAAYGFAGQPMKGLESVQRALELLPFTDTPLEGAILVAKCVCLCPAGRYDEMMATAAKAGETLGNKSNLLNLAVALAARVGYADHIIACTYQGIRGDDEKLEFGRWAADQIDAPYLHNILWSRKGFYLAWTGRHEEAQEIIELITQNSRKVGAPMHQAALYLRPYMLWQRGEFEEAKALVMQAIRYPHLEHDDFHQQLIYQLKGKIHLALGELETAETDLVAAYKRGQFGKMGLVTIQALLGLGELAVAKGDLAEAKAKFEEALALSQAKETRNPLHEAISRRFLAELAIRVGALAQARPLLDAAMAIVTRPEQDNLLEQGNLHRIYGDLALAEGQLEQARQAFLKAAELFHGMKNRHLLRYVSNKLEELRRPEATNEPIFSLPEERKDTRLSMLSTQWREKFKLSASTLANEAQLYQALLQEAMDSVGAEDASLYVVSPATTWVASRNGQGPTAELRANPEYLAQVVAERAGLTAIDLPSEMALGVGSNLELELPSVLVSPVVSKGQVVAVFYLTKRDISEPFGDEDQQILDNYGELVSSQFADRLASQTVLSKTIGQMTLNSSRLAEELRLSLSNASLAGKSQHDLVAHLLGEVAKKLNLDGIAVVKAGNGQLVSHFGKDGVAPRINQGFVTQVAESGAPFCGIDMPETITGSAADVELSSVLLTPMEPQAVEHVLYGVRRNIEEALTDEQFPIFGALAAVIAEAVASLQALGAPSGASDRLAEELRSLLATASLAGKSQHDLVGDMLAELAAKLKLDGVALVTGADRQVLSASGQPIRINDAYVQQVVESGAPHCGIDMPETITGSAADVELSSVLVTPLRKGDALQGVLYGMRRDIEDALTDEQLPVFQACAAVMAEAVADLAALSSNP